MTSHRRVSLTAVGVVALVLAGCPDGLFSAAGSRGAGFMRSDGPITRIDGFDHEAMKVSLQGDWLVTRDAKRLFEFAISDETITVIDHRFAQPRKIAGELLLRSATSFGVLDSVGTHYFFSFVESEGTTYMGQGGAVSYGEDESFEVSLGAWETLTRTETGCRLRTQFGDRVADKDVECGFHERAGAKGKPGVAVFRYQAVDPFRPDRLKKIELRVVGHYLMEEELVKSVASRRGAAPSSTGSKAPGKPEGD